MLRTEQKKNNNSLGEPGLHDHPCKEGFANVQYELPKAQFVPGVPVISPAPYREKFVLFIHPFQRSCRLLSNLLSASD